MMLINTGTVKEKQREYIVEATIKRKRRIRTSFFVFFYVY